MTMIEKERAKFSVTKKDLTITWFSGTGAGGQHRNKHQNCIRIKHNDTGIIVTGQSYRERSGNIREAMNSLAKHPKFKSYCDLRLREMEMGMTIDEWVDKQMALENIEVNVKADGKWVKEEVS